MIIFFNQHERMTVEHKSANNDDIWTYEVISCSLAQFQLVPVL